MTKTSDCVNSYVVGLNKGFVVTKIEKVPRPSARKCRTSNRVRQIRKLVRSVVDLNPVEKRILEMFKTGVQQVEKRAFKQLRKRLGKRSRAIKKRDELKQIIRNMQGGKKEKKVEEKA